MKRFFSLLFLIPVLTGCSGNGATPPASTQSASSQEVTVSWQASRESAVNRTGGGYTIYYSSQPGAALSAATTVVIPYVSGPSTPTSTKLTLPVGTHYFRISAFSSLGGGTQSEPSAEIPVTVP